MTSKLAIAGFAAAAALCVTQGVAAQLTIEKAVVMSRHGVRPPTNSPRAEPLSIKGWPSWGGIPDGQLTLHGYAATVEMGRWYKTRYGELFASGKCPPANDVFAWSNTDQRTRQTANAILDGMFPGCGLRVKTKHGEGRDSLFAPIAQNLAPLNIAQAKKDMLATMGGSLEAARQKWAAAVDEMDKVLPCCQPRLCEKEKLGASCSFKDLPWTFDEDKDHGRNIGLEGGLDLASNIGETFRLQYAENMPLEQIGFGRVKSAEDIKRLLALHTVKYDYLEHVPYIARRGASQLLSQILLALRQGAGEAVEGGPPATKFLLFVGHDTNIAHMRAAMGVNWELKNYPLNDTPPDGALVYELLKDAGGKRYVRMSYFAQTLDQLRNLTALKDGEAPEVVMLPIPGCKTQVENACALSEFGEFITSKLDTTAMTRGEYN